MTMEEMAESFPEWLLEAEELTKHLPFEEMSRKLIVGAMGGSAIGADFVNTAYYDVLPPIPVIRDYRLPFWIGDGTFIASSYSGNTEETLTLMSEAVKRKLQIVGVSSDGEVEKYCLEHNRPFVNYLLVCLHVWLCLTRPGSYLFLLKTSMALSCPGKKQWRFLRKT